MQNTYDLSNLIPTALADFFEIASKRSPNISAGWSEHEYADIFGHLLKSPLLIIKNDDDDSTGQPNTDVADNNWCPIQFADALFSDTPDSQVIELIKRFAKREHRDPNSYLPRPVALLLYYLAIAVAISRLHDPMTTLSDHELAIGLDWALRQKWVDEASHTIIQTVRQQINA